MKPPAFDSQITFIYVDDLGRSAEFYGGVLGFEVARDQGVCLIYRVAEQAFLGVCSHRRPQPDGVIITLVSDDVDGWAARLTDAGYEVEGPATSQEFAIRHLFVHDPDGHPVEIQRFDAPLSSDE